LVTVDSHEPPGCDGVLCLVFATREKRRNLKIETTAFLLASIEDGPECDVIKAQV
jgi:hypothetical protein